MTKEEMKTLDSKYIAGTYGRYDVALVSGDGVRVKDPDGKEYIDFTSGVGVNALGYGDPGWVKAVADQAAKLQHASNLIYTEPCIKVAEQLIKRTGLVNVFFGNSGAEANEAAIKIARKYSRINYGADVPDSEYTRYEIITLNQSFHGRTIATVSATGQDSFHKDFGPFVEGFVYAEPGDAEDLKAKITDNTCAIIIEFIQGEGGVNNLSKDYVNQVSKMCAANDILLIADEVQTGIGRTGTFYAYEQFDVLPDIVTTAKGLGGGLPIGAAILGEKTKDVLSPGDHGSTFGGNPVACAGAEYVLSRIDGNFLAHVREMGEYFSTKLSAMKGVSEVTGKGLMIGITPCDKKPADVVAACAEQGLLALTAKNRLRLLPPLIIGKDDADAGLAILESVLR